MQSDVKFSDSEVPVNPQAKEVTPEEVQDSPVAPAVAPDTTDYVYVTFPDGSLHAIPRSALTAQSAGVPAYVPTEPEQDFYVHLADGSVERVKESEVPGYAGSNAVNGHFVRDGKTYVVTGVYPVETEVKGN